MAERRREQFVSLVGVVALALALPLILRMTNTLVRYVTGVGAEGRLSAISVETDRALGPLPSPWRGIAQGGEEIRTFLNDNVEQVKKIKPGYIRIDHIYDQFEVVRKDINGLSLNWTELDKTVKQITDTGALPFFSLSYMPGALSSGDDTSEPRDWNDWQTLVQKTIEHYSGEMGLDAIYYEVWNEPDLFGKWTMGGKKDYRLLYSFAARGAAAADTRGHSFKIGGPGTTGLYKNWMDQFFPYILDNQLRLDFFSWHRYDLDVEKYMQDTQEVDSWLERQPYFAGVEKIVTEMGPDSKPGGSNKNEIGAAHLVAIMRELMFRVNLAFSFSVTGQWGILNTPRYQAMSMLSDLGGQRLSIMGEGSWVRAIGAVKDQTYQVLLTNYDPKEAHSELVPVTFINLKNRNYTLKQKILGIEGDNTTEVATTEAVLQRQIPMSPNSVVLLELTPKL